MQRRRLEGALLGMMCGDSLGLPFENLSARRVRAWMGERPLRQSLILGRGMVSDDTEHAAMTVGAWRASRRDPRAFARGLAWRLRGWFICIPAATGMATARACLKLLVGCPPTRSGVKSAGNGPLMRAIPLGVLCDSEHELAEFVNASSRITHTDSRAVDGALAVALGAMVAATNQTDELPARFGEACARALTDPDVIACVDGALASVARAETTSAFAASIRCADGVSGFVMHTLPVVVHAWLSSPNDAARAVSTVVRLGGDTDTTGALVGGLVGAHVGEAGLPREWLAGVIDFPCSVSYVRRLAGGAAGGGAMPSRLRWAVLPVRNIMFLCIVLAHALRRLLPPYA